MDTQTFVFFGIIGSGKGTQIKLLMKYIKDKDPSTECLYAGTGEEFRKLISSNNYTADRVKETLIKGELQPDFLTTSLFTNVLVNFLKEDKHLFTDGYPRTLHQSESFDAMMKFFKRNNIKIINIEINEEEVMKRNLLRARSDDTVDGIKSRIEDHKKNVVPAMDYFREIEDYEILTIDGEQTIEKVHRDIIRAINL